MKKIHIFKIGVFMFAVIAVASVAQVETRAVSISSKHHIQNRYFEECQVKKYLRANGKGIFRSQADEVMKASLRYNINPAFMVGVARQEGGLGHTIQPSDMRNRNPGNVKTPRDILAKEGIRIKGFDETGHTKFRKWQDGWYGMAEVFSRNYIPYGRTTAYEVVTNGYAEANHSGWAAAVNETIERIDSVNCKDRSKPHHPLKR